MFGGINRFVEETLVSIEFDMETNGNYFAKLWPKLFFEHQIPEHGFRLRLMDYFEQQ